jgi:hypothetical protein
MRDIQKAGGVAALLGALLAVANLVVIFGLIGPSVLGDRARLVDIAINQPTPLLALDLIKLLSAAAALVLVVALPRRLRAAPDLMRLATACGIISIALLLANGVISYTVVAQAASFYGGDPAIYLAVNAIINALGFAAIFANGGWYLLVSWAALAAGELPKALALLGLVLGVISLIVFVLQPLALAVLLIGLIWSTWLGVVLLRGPAPGRAPVVAQA